MMYPCLQVFLGLAAMRYAPGDAFMAAFHARVEAQAPKFTYGMWGQLKQAYDTLGVQPSRAISKALLSFCEQ